jgi:hypothetical protein
VEEFFACERIWPRGFENDAEGCTDAPLPNNILIPILLLLWYRINKYSGISISGGLVVFQQITAT